MEEFVVYKEATGEITKFASGSLEFAELQVEAGEALLPCEAPERRGVYVYQGEVTPRPEMPVQITNQTVTVPPSTEFNVRGPAELSGQADETGVLEFEFDEPGEYTIELRCFPYLDKEITLHAD